MEKKKVLWNYRISDCLSRNGQYSNVNKVYSNP